MTKSLEQQAAEHGLSRQTYTHRLKTWVEVIIDGKKYLVSPKHMMEVKEPQK